VTLRLPVTASTTRGFRLSLVIDGREAVCFMVAPIPMAAVARLARAHDRGEQIEVVVQAVDREGNPTKRAEGDQT
jgi:hypothetical protein